MEYFENIILINNFKNTFFEYTAICIFTQIREKKTFLRRCYVLLHVFSRLKKTVTYLIESNQYNVIDLAVITNRYISILYGLYDNLIL